MLARVCALCMSTKGAAERSTAYYQLWRCRLGTNTAQDRLGYIVYVKINEGRFRPENHYVWNQFVAFMPVAIRETACAWNSSEKSNVRTRRNPHQLHK